MHRTYASTTSPEQAHTRTCARRHKCTYAHKRTLYIEPLKQRLRGQSRSQTQTTVMHVCSAHIHTNAHARRIGTFVGKSGDWLML